MKLRDYNLFSRIMQLVLAGVLLFGVYLGNTKIIMNSLISLLITFAPALLERRYDITLNPFLGLWITSAVFMHAVGAANFTETNLYTSIWWWDHFTHTLSSSVVAAVGYTSFRVLDEHSGEIHVPKKMMFVFILVFVMAFGVIWELLEFGLAQLADILGGEPILTQYGLEDTMKDLVFDTVGGLLVALLGEAHLNDTVEQIKIKLEDETGIELLK